MEFEKALKENCSSKSKKLEKGPKKKKMEEQTATADIRGTDNPSIVDWYGNRKKKKQEIVRRKLYAAAKIT
jgi:hypothetical protein